MSKKAAKLLYGGVLDTLDVTDLQSYLIYGPSNVGKTYLASMLQEYSPFDIVDCQQINSTIGHISASS